MSDFYISLSIGLIGVLLFRFRNRNKDRINIISFATIGIFATQFFFFEVSELAGLLAWAAFSLGLLISYALRFKNKENKEVIDHLKLVCIGLVVLYPINFYSWMMLQNNLNIIAAFASLIVPITGAIYFYDRWILKPEKMKKKFLIILIGQSIIILIALTYAFVQKGIADEKQREASQQYQLAVEQARQAAEMRVKLENCH